MTNYETKRSDASNEHCRVYLRDDFMGDPKHEFALEKFEYGFDAGFQYAIELLRSVDEQTNGGITNCLHSTEWAKYLEKQKESETAV